jgi:hypothetical protein
MNIACAFLGVCLPGKASAFLATNNLRRRIVQVILAHPVILTAAGSWPTILARPVVEGNRRGDLPPPAMFPDCATRKLEFAEFVAIIICVVAVIDTGR